MNSPKTIGIIGGQSPVSTADFYLRIVKYYQDNYGAKLQADYPPMVIFSVPAPDLISGIENEEMSYRMMADAIKKLERDDCAFIVIACNSVQFLNDRLQELVKIPLVGIAEVVSKYVQDEGYKSVGVLGTHTTVSKNIYGRVLQKQNVETIAPTQADQKTVEQVIRHGNEGIILGEDRDKLVSVMKDLQTKGAEAVLLACTELPLIVKQSDTTIPVIDCSDLYAIHTAELSRP